MAGIVAALRPEKNHEMFLHVAALVRWKLPAARFLVVGDGPQRAKLEALAKSLGIAEAVRFLGTRSDVPEVLSLVDVLVLTSHMEANPICLLEAMASEKPVVATRVGSVSRDGAGRPDRLPRAAGRLAGHGRPGAGTAGRPQRGPPPWAAPAASTSSPTGRSTAWCKATRT